MNAEGRGARVEQQTEVEQAELEQLKAENAQLNEQLRREHDLYLRMAADFANYRRRNEQDREQASRAGVRALVLSLLDVMDDFERALGHARQGPQSVMEGVEAMYRRLNAILAAEGVTPFESLGQAFNPSIHEAVGVVDSDEHESGTVIDVIGQGYLMGQDLLRPARVRVAR